MENITISKNDLTVNRLSIREKLKRPLLMIYFLKGNIKGTEEEVMEVFRKVRNQIKDGFYKFYKENISK